MKTRQDFVSNSSSCSFIIHIKSDKEKKLIEDLENKKVVYVDKDLDYWQLPSYSDEWVRLDFGDDTLETIESFDDYRREFERLNSECYEDDLAHYTFGKKISKSEY